MPRQMRVQYPGAIYHVMSRGGRREDIYLDDVARHDFLKTLAQACQKTSWLVHAYCLMRNHFHLVVETPEGNLVEGMGWLLSAYTTRLNLAVRRKNAPKKLAMAARLRKETTLTVKEIAARVVLGTSKTANSWLHQFMRLASPKNPSPMESELKKRTKLG